MSPDIPKCPLGTKGQNCPQSRILSEALKFVMRAECGEISKGHEVGEGNMIQICCCPTRRGQLVQVCPEREREREMGQISNPPFPPLHPKVKLWKRFLGSPSTYGFSKPVKVRNLHDSIAKVPIQGWEMFINGWGWCLGSVQLCWGSSGRSTDLRTVWRRQLRVSGGLWSTQVKNQLMEQQQGARSKCSLTPENPMWPAKQAPGNVPEY